MDLVTQLEAATSEKKAVLFKCFVAWAVRARVRNAREDQSPLVLQLSDSLRSIMMHNKSIQQRLGSQAMEMGALKRENAALKRGAGAMLVKSPLSAFQRDKR